MSIRNGGPKSISSAVKYKKSSPKKWSIQKCLIILGAKDEEVYVDDAHRTVHNCRLCGSKIYSRASWKPATELERRKGNRTVYNRFTVDELLIWVESLWKEASFKYHPNKHRNKEFYTKKFQEISEAYHRAKYILSYRGSWV